MIRIINELSGNKVKVFTSTTRIIPAIPDRLGSWIDVVTHDLGQIPDKVDIMMAGDTVEDTSWHMPTGPYAQYGDNTNHYCSNVEYSIEGCLTFSKSSTDFKVLFQAYWAGKKVFYKAYIFGGGLRET
jgi:hypothetical protein